MSVDLGTAYGRIVIDGSGATAGFRSAAGGALGLRRALVGLGVGTIVTKVFTDTYRAARDFGQAMADLNAIADVTPEKLAALEAAAIRAGQSTRFSATEAAQAQVELAKAGLTAEQILGGGLDTALALAAAGNLGVADSATIAANAVQAFGLNQAELASVADAYAIAANRTTADVGDFGLAMAQSGAAARQSGLSFKETTTFLEALALQGVKGSDAGTSLKAALLSLVAPVGDGAKAIKEYGLEFFQANGEIKSAAGIARELEDKLGGLNRQQRTAVLQAIAGRDGFRALASVLDLGAKGTVRLRRGLDETGEAARVAAERQDSLAGDVEQLGGAFEALQIQASKKAVPALRGIARSATDAINAISSGDGNLGEIFDGVASAGAGVGTVLQNILGLTLSIAAAGVALSAPFVSLTGGIIESEAGTRILTAALVGVAAAYVAAKVAAAALFAVQKAQAIFATVQAFVQLATTVRSAAGAMALMQAATLATPFGIVAAGVGIAVGAVALLTDGFRSGPSAADLMAQSLDRVRDAAQNAAGALDRARLAADKITDTKLATAAAALAVEQAERTYSEAVARSGKDSLEARSAANQLEQSRRRLIQANRDGNAAVQEASVANAAELSSALKRKQAADEGIVTFQRYLAINEALNSTTAAGRAKSEEYRQKIAELSVESDRAGKQINGIKDAARDAARALAGDARPGAEAVRKELLLIANAKPADLPKVVAAVSNGTLKALGITRTRVKDIQAKLADVDQPVSLASFIASIAGGMSGALSTALNIAAQIRRALRNANADVRQSPSANDLMRASLVRMEGITGTGLKRTLSATRRGVDSILQERTRLEARLDALDRAQAAREAASQGTTGRFRLQQRADRAGRVGTLISSVESGASDLVSRIGQALDERVRQYDARLAAINAQRNILAGGRAIEDADAALSAAQTRLARIQDIIANATSDTARANAEKLLAGAMDDVEAARLDAEAARIQLERDKASLTAEKKKEEITRDIGNLVERLRAGKITAARFNREILAILGDPEIRAALQASGVSLGLAFTRGLARTRSAVAAAAKALAQEVAAYLRMRSPAERGPLAFDFTRSGRVIGEDFAAGLADQRRRMALEALAFAASAVPPTSRGAATGGAPVAAAGGVQQTNVFNVQGPFDARQAVADLKWETDFAFGGGLS